MNATTYQSDKKVASIQPGSNWGLAFEALSPYGVTVVGGRASVVGVGGFTTGGGVSKLLDVLSSEELRVVVN